MKKKAEWVDWEGDGSALQAGGIVLNIVRTYGGRAKWVLFSDPSFFKYEALASPKLEEAKVQAVAKLQVYLQDALEELTGGEV